MRNGGTGIWQGFDFEWSKTSHRVHRLASWLDDLEGDEAGVRGSCASRFSVGRVPDAGVARTYVGGIRSRHLRFREGSAAIELGATNGEAAELDGERVEVAAGGAATVVLRGFRLRCTSHDAGIHPQGFGVQLRDISREAGSLSFTPRFYVHATNSPDFVTGWKGQYHSKFEALYTVVSGPSEAVSFAIPCNEQPCAAVAHVRRDRLEAEASVAGHSRLFSHGTVGLRGFRWEQKHRSRWDRNGRFMRRFEAHTGHQDYDADTGVARFKPRMFFSNDGMIPYPVRAEHKMWTTLIQYSDDRPRLDRREVAHQIKSGVGEGAEGFSRFELT